MTHPIVWSLSLSSLPVTLLVFLSLPQISYFQLNPCLRFILVELKIRHGPVEMSNMQSDKWIWNSRRGSHNLWVVSRKMVFVPVICCSKRDYPKISWLKQPLFFFFFVTHNFMDQNCFLSARQFFCSTWHHLRSVIRWYSAASAGKTVSRDRKSKVWTGMKSSPETSNSKRPASWGRASSREWALPALYAADKSTHIKNWHCEHLLGPRDIE